ncbi:MAG: thioesterase family protein [Defluviitaleaceae bacterium]|nr:thioesterase family protein [Defluviitaleaceae bacterium]
MANDSNLAPGLSHSMSEMVNATNTATAVHSGGLDVYSTPSMIALMESAAYKCIESHLCEGQTTVGTVVNIEHLTASPIGVQITATATIDSVDGRKVNFTVSASDNSGEIGKGKHTRFIVDIDRFMSKVQARA